MVLCYGLGSNPYISLAIVAFPIFGKKPSTPLATKTSPRAPGTPESSPDDRSDALGPRSVLGGDASGAPSEETIEVRDLGYHLPEAIEQAAMLYSMEQTDAAGAILAASIYSEDFGKFAPRAWGMLFELYQHLGNRAEFEQLATAYVARFETSPPTWVQTGVEAKPVAAAPKSPVGKSFVVLNGPLSAEAEATLQQLFKMAERNASVRLDVGKVTDVDDAGCQRLLEVMQQLRQAGKECVLSGTPRLVTMLGQKVQAGVAENAHLWRLLLDIQQRTYNQDAFEEVAVNYAITFEVSPPSYEPPKTPKAGLPVIEAEPEEEATDDAEPDDCILEGVIVGAGEKAFVTIRQNAEHGAEVAVDASRLERMDFVAATNLLNFVNTLAVLNKRVRFVKVSHLVTALWEVIGLNAVAKVETRKY